MGWTEFTCAIWAVLTCACEALSVVGCGHGPAFPRLHFLAQNYENPGILNWNQAFQLVLMDYQGGKITHLIEHVS